MEAPGTTEHGEERIEIVEITDPLACCGQRIAITIAQASCGQGIKFTQQSRSLLIEIV